MTTAQKKPKNTLHKESAKAKRNKERREKMGLKDLSRLDPIKERMERDFERAWGGTNPICVRNDAGKLMEQSYPSEKMLEEDLLTAEEVAAAEAHTYGSKGLPAVDDSPWNGLDDPEFLHQSAKAGPPVKKAPVDALGRVNGATFPKEATPSSSKEQTEAVNAILLPDSSASSKSKTTRHIVLTKDHDLEYPDLYIAIHVLPDPAVSDDEARFARWLARCGCYKARDLKSADLVIFAGGSDVDPSLYGETAYENTFFVKERDDADMDAYVACREEGIPMLGVCRGAQFLHVMNGGKLYQDVDKHYGDHKMYCMKDKLMIDKVSSVHHQSCKWSTDMEVLATTALSTKRWLNATEKEESKAGKADIEAFFYRDTGCLGVQGHPEYRNYNKFSIWVAEKIQDYFLNSPDFMWEKKGGRLRMTAEAKDAGKIAAAYIENAYSTAREA